MAITYEFLSGPHGKVIQVLNHVMNDATDGFIQQNPTGNIHTF